MQGTSYTIYILYGDTFYCIELQGTSDKYTVIILLMVLETELQVLLWITVEFPKKVMFHVSRLHSSSFAKGVKNSY